MRWPYHNVSIAVTEKVIALLKLKSPAVGTRVQCLLKDVIDLRLNGWLCHRPKQLEAPRKLDGAWQAAVFSQVGMEMEMDSHGGLEVTIRQTESNKKLPTTS